MRKIYKILYKTLMKAVYPGPGCVRHFTRARSIATVARFALFTPLCPRLNHAKWKSTRRTFHSILNSNLVPIEIWGSDMVETDVPLTYDLFKISEYWIPTNWFWFSISASRNSYYIWVLFNSKVKCIFMREFRTSHKSR